MRNIDKARAIIARAEEFGAEWEPDSLALDTKGALPYILLALYDRLGESMGIPAPIDPGTRLTAAEVSELNGAIGVLIKDEPDALDCN